MPVWEEYPPPCTAYEAYYLELDQLRYMNKLGDQVRSSEDFAVYPFLEVNQYRDYDSSAVSPQTPQRDPYQQPTSIYTMTNHINESEEEPEISQSPGKKSPGTREIPELKSSFPQHNSFPLENTASLEQSSEISLTEENKEESEIDVSDDDHENPFPGTGKKRTGALFPERDAANSADPGKEDHDEDDDEITQPKKRQRTTPDQLEVLEKVYEKEKLPGSDLRRELAQKLKMTPRRVQVWFQNKRAKEKRMGVCK
jgi:hypothetical protein